MCLFWSKLEEIAAIVIFVRRVAITASALRWAQRRPWYSTSLLLGLDGNL